MRAGRTAGQSSEGRGVGRGSKVLVALPNSPAFLLSLLAVNECGAVFMPVNPGLAADERQRIDEIARPDVVIADRGTVELLPGTYLSRTGWTPYGDEDVSGLAAIIFTSGTTGTPKGVMMTEEALLANARGVAGTSACPTPTRPSSFFRSTTPTRSRRCSAPWWPAAPWCCCGICSSLSWSSGDRRAPDHRVRRRANQPEHSRHQRAAFGRSVDSLRYILSAGGPLAPAVVDRVQAAFPGAALFNNYGCTEIGPRATAVDYTSTPDKIGSIGRAIPGVASRLRGPICRWPMPRKRVRSS